MENLILIGTVIVVHLLAAAMPGPDFIMTVRNSLSYSRRTGIYTAIGIGAGIGVHITYCLAGLAVIISQSIIVFNVIKLLGAAYIIYIGVKSIIAKSSNIEIKNEKHYKKDLTKLKAFKIGFLTNVLNPKASLFFLGLFTLVIKPDTPYWMLGILSTIMITNNILWFTLVAMFFTQKHVRSIFFKFQNIFHKTFGGILILLGIKIALSKK